MGIRLSPKNRNTPNTTEQQKENIHNTTELTPKGEEELEKLLANLSRIFVER